MVVLRKLCLAFGLLRNSCLSKFEALYGDWSYSQINMYCELPFHVTWDRVKVLLYITN